MKRLFCAASALLLILLLAACSGESGNFSDLFTTEGADEQVSVFTPCQDLKVIAAYIYDTDTSVIVENCGNKPIVKYTVAYMQFDRNGLLCKDGSKEYTKGYDDSVNLMPGEKAHSTWWGAKGMYATAAITKVEYADGTVWEASGLSSWVETQKNTFSVTDHNAKLSSLNEDAKKAENCNYASIDHYSIDHDNQFSTRKDFSFTLTNHTDKGILKINIFVLEFDKNGYPVSVSPYDTFCLNGHSTGGTVNVAAGTTDDFETTLFIFGSTTQVKFIIRNIEFSDGTVWENPWQYEWILLNNKGI